MPLIRVLALALAAFVPAGAAEDYQVYTEHPRILLGRSRLRLLKRDRERSAPRWQQFEALIEGQARMPEGPLADALYYRVAENREAGQRAVRWALGKGPNDLRHMALVFDWCQDLLNETERRALAGRLRDGLEHAAKDAGLPAVRARVLAAVAVAGHDPDPSAGALARIIEDWWQGRIVPELKSGRDPLPAAHYYSLLEILHVIRDNLNIDLRRDAPEYFEEIAARRLLGYYPASYPAGENDYRIPAGPLRGEPDLVEAALARATDLAIVAYDLNSPGGQLLQGWLMNDRFQMCGPFGAPYELIWANPYQPGLSYYHAPLVFHDSKYGRLFVRSSWEEDAAWLGTIEGRVQTFREGRRGVLEVKPGPAPVSLTEALVFFAGPELRFKARLQAEEQVFVLGLKPRCRYQVEVDDQELVETAADPGGILEVELPPHAATAFRLREAPSYSGR